MQLLSFREYSPGIRLLSLFEHDLLVATIGRQVSSLTELSQSISGQDSNYTALRKLRKV